MTDSNKRVSRPFTNPERIVVDVLLAAHADRRVLSASDIYNTVWQSDRVSYDQTFRALRNLVKRGTVVKPRRGLYRLAT